jgi:glyoxylase-like metal-dependent hydrolase (beta-lactamase superfamily II)
MCPIGGSLLGGKGLPVRRARLVCHCLLIETNDGLVLVDTGLGSADIAQASERFGTHFVFGMGPRLDPEETALRRVEALGFSAADVRHVVLTHMDVDHAGGLPDFPHAKVHVHAAELDAAEARSSLTRKLRYYPVQWAHGVDWVLHGELGEPWFGFECVRALPGLPPEIVIVPLFGHTLGHTGVAVEQAGDRWLLHAGDSYFHRGEVHAGEPRCPAGLAGFQSFMQEDGGARHANRRRLRALAAERPEIRIFSAHDPVELERMTAGEGV